MAEHGKKKATLYRMVSDEHLCPYGLKTLDLLKQHGFEVEDHHLTSREETEAFKREHGVETTPQVFIEGRRIGGYEDLRVHLGIDPPPEARSDTTYRPVLAIFGVAAALAMAVSWHSYGTLATGRAVEWFVSIAMTLLALQKLQDVESFSTVFLNYDLLARRWVPYAYIYPWAEALAGVLMTAGALTWISAPVALLIGTIGAVSVIRAVYVEGRELRCACVGGDSRVPLGAISLTENLAMVGMGLWGLFKLLAA